MNHGSLFSGIGGFDLAAEWMGWDNIFHCEWNDFGKKVLKYYWPKSISYHDITKTDFTIHRGTIDILTGGFPCQPYSTAGKRLGKEDERHLWPEMLRAIREIEPTWIVGENVRGLVSWSGGLVFEEVCADLEAQGYSVQPFLLPAASVNAPHRRDRVWFVAHSKNSGCRRRESEQCSVRERKLFQGEQGRCEMGSEVEGCGGEQFATNSNNERECNGLGQIQAENGEVSQRNHNAEFSNSDKLNDATDSDSKRIEECYISEISRKQVFANRPHNERRGNWQNFPTVAPVCNGDDGLSDRLDSITFPKWRNESIKAGGNAIVPQVAHQIFKAIQNYENQTKLF